MALQEHTGNRAQWQYPHDSYAHFLEGALEHGAADRNDDSILEKGNRRKKRYGDRNVFRGGKNYVWDPELKKYVRPKWKSRRQGPEIGPDGKPTGRRATKTVWRHANEGQAAQTQRLDLIGQICEAGRPSKRAKMTVDQLTTERLNQEARGSDRALVLVAVEEFKIKVSPASVPEPVLEAES